MKMYRGVEVYLHAFLTLLALDGSEWSASCPRCFTPEKYPLNRRLSRPQSQSGHGSEEKNIPTLAGDQTMVIQPIA
jgi:hypothetical protein